MLRKSIDVRKGFRIGYDRKAPKNWPKDSYTSYGVPGNAGPNNNLPPSGRQISSVVADRDSGQPAALALGGLPGLYSGRPMRSYTFKAVITIIVTGFVGAAWLGFKVLLGK